MVVLQQQYSLVCLLPIVGKGSLNLHFCVLFFFSVLSLYLNVDVFRQLSYFVVYNMLDQNNMQ